MDTKKIAYFLEITRLKSISRAANKLRVDQSILNRAVRALEEELGSKLYVHYDKTFKLTERGKIAYEHFRKITSYCNDLKKAIVSLDKRERTELTIRSSNGMANFFLISSLSPFLQENNGIFFSFSTNDLVQSLDVGIDVCVGPKLHGEDIENFYLFSYYLKMFASADYLNRMGHPKVPEDLDKHHLIAYSKQEISTFMDFDWHLRYGSLNGVQRKPYLEASSSYALRRAAEEGLGIITFSKYLMERDSPQLVDVFPDHKGLKVDIYFSHRPTSPHHKVILLYRDFLFKYFRSLPFHDS